MAVIAVVAGSVTWSRLASTRLSTLSDPLITESSGLTASVQTPGVLWTINDSGSPPLLFATDRLGRSLGRFFVSGAQNHDWEDIGTARAADGAAFLFIADTGKDGGNHPPVIYRVREPAVEKGREHRRIVKTDKAAAFPLVFPGDPVDIETMLVHPDTGEILLVGKTGNGHAPVFRIERLGPPGKPVNLELVSTIEMAPLLGWLTAATGGAVAPDGSRFVVRTPISAYEWQAPPGKTLAEAIQTEPRVMPIVIPTLRGEAIAYDPRRDALLSTSEGADAPLYLTELATQRRMHPYGQTAEVGLDLASCQQNAHRDCISASG